MSVIELVFEPIAQLGDVAVRLETLGIAVAVLAALLVAARIARVTPVDVDADERAGILGPAGDDHLRRDDLLFVVLGSIPGAVGGGRLTYALLHPDFYAASPAALLDPGRGSLELMGAVLGGSLTASIVAALLDAPVSRWFHVAALPMLLAIALGKAAQALGGSGQGLPADAPWATAYAGHGPWASLAPDLPSHPAQLYEAAGVAGALVLVIVLSMVGAFDRRDGRAFAVALGLWAVARIAVASVWRDSAVAGPLRGAQLIAVVALAIAAAALVLAPRLAGRAERKSVEERAELAWPDPASRPRF